MNAIIDKKTSGSYDQNSNAQNVYMMVTIMRLINKKMIVRCLTTACGGSAGRRKMQMRG
jgi:hypothetical protein